MDAVYWFAPNVWNSFINFVAGSRMKLPQLITKTCSHADCRFHLVSSLAGLLSNNDIHCLRYNLCRIWFPYPDSFTQLASKDRLAFKDIIWLARFGRTKEHQGYIRFQSYNERR